MDIHSKTGIRYDFTMHLIVHLSHPLRKQIFFMKAHACMSVHMTHVH